MNHFDLIKNRNYFLGFGAFMVAASIVCITVFGLRQGIDLKGGTQWRVAFEDTSITSEAVRAAIQPLTKEGESSVKQSEPGSFILRLPSLSEERHAEFRGALGKLGTYEEQSFSNIGPTIGAELRARAMKAIIVVLLGISLYIAYAFRKVSKPIASWKYGAATLITLFHDVAIPTGLLAILGYAKGIEIDTNFIVALLVVMGLSVHDTIVVFDRIRENILVHRGKQFTLADTVNYSVRETFARSVNTTLTLVIVLAALLVFGPSSLYYFILTILIGTVFGTYSSIFLASPLVYLWGKGKE